MVPFLDLHRQYLSIKEEIDEAIERTIAHSAFINGPSVAAFEEEFASWIGARHCIGVANGTDALEIAIEALDLPPSSEIIVPANSFIATSEAVTRSGHKVVFADIDPGCYTLDPDSVRAKLTTRTRAIIAVHLYGHPCDMDPLESMASEHGLRVIEDCAQAPGATYLGRPVGTIGDVGTWSFYPGKNLGAFGDAGAITSADGALATRMRMIANHGRIAKYDHEFEGRNSRLDGLQAAILRVKLRHLDRWTAARISAAEAYCNGLSNLADVVLPVQKEWARQVYHLFVVRTERRDDLAAYLKQRGIQTGIHYPTALPKLKAYEKHTQHREPLAACRLDSRLLSLPMGEHLTKVDVDEVVGAVRAFFVA